LCKLLVIFSGHYNKRIWYEIDNSLQEMVWLKKNGQSPGFVSYLLKTEPILVFGKPKGRYAMDLFERLLVFNDDLKGEHTCPKPVDLMMDLLKPQVGTNGIVLDLFGGSGSTMVAAASCRRRCYMMEIDPVYVQVIIDRMKKLGANAKKIN